MNILSWLLLLIIAVWFLLSIKRMIDGKGSCCTGNCSCCNKGCNQDK